MTALYVPRQRQQTQASREEAWGVSLTYDSLVSGGRANPYRSQEFGLAHVREILVLAMRYAYFFSGRWLRNGFV